LYVNAGFPGKSYYSISIVPLPEISGDEDAVEVFLDKAESFTFVTFPQLWKGLQSLLYPIGITKQAKRGDISVLSLDDVWLEGSSTPTTIPRMSLEQKFRLLFINLYGESEEQDEDNSKWDEFRSEVQLCILTPAKRTMNKINNELYQSRFPTYTDRRPEDRMCSGKKIFPKQQEAFYIPCMEGNLLDFETGILAPSSARKGEIPSITYSGCSSCTSLRLFIDQILNPKKSISFGGYVLPVSVEDASSHLSLGHSSTDSYRGLTQLLEKDPSQIFVLDTEFTSASVKLDIPKEVMEIAISSLDGSKKFSARVEKEESLLDLIKKHQARSSGSINTSSPVKIYGNPDDAVPLMSMENIRTALKSLGVTKDSLFLEHSMHWCDPGSLEVSVIEDIPARSAAVRSTLLFRDIYTPEVDVTGPQALQLQTLYHTFFDDADTIHFHRAAGDVEATRRLILLVLSAARKEQPNLANLHSMVPYS